MTDGAHISPARRGAMLLCGALLLAFGLCNFIDYNNQGTWLHTRSAEEVLELPEPVHSDSRLLLARTLLDDVFPAVPERAVELTADSIAATPQRADAWLIHARALFLLGERNAARAALERSDALDPMYGQQRMRATQLWALLGEDERAWQLARDVADRSEQPGWLVQQLLRSGFRAPEIVENLVGDQSSPDEAADILLELPRTTKISQLESSIPGRLWEDEEFRRRLFLRLVETRDFAMLWRLGGSADSKILAPNTDLHERPFTDESPLGWHAPKADAPFLVSWQGAESDQTSPTLFINFTEQDGGEIRLNWPCFRFLLESDSGCEASLTILSPPEAAHTLWLTALAEGERLRSEPIHRGSGLRTLSLRVPPSPDPQLIELIIEGRISPSHGAPSEFAIGGFAIHAE